MKYLSKLLTIVILALLTSCGGCKRPEPPNYANRTVLLYMIADNNLYNNAIKNINELKEAWKSEYPGTVLVYLNPRNSTSPSILYKIRKDKLEIVKEYVVAQNACDPAVLSQVIADTREFAPAESFGLVLWSHGTGWLQKGQDGLKTDSNPSYSFGANNTYGDEMEIRELAEALPNNLIFDFIAFDACYMAAIEVSYELRNKARYVIASASESLAAGYPYNEVLPNMMAKEADVVGIAKGVFNHYNAQTGLYRSSTMSVVQCAKLPALAASLRAIVKNDTPSLPKLSEIQRFAVNSFFYTPLFFDLGDFVNKTWSKSMRLSAFNNILNEAVVYQASTPKLYAELNVLTHCGLTAHIPQSEYPISLSFFRSQFAWSADSGLGEIVF